MTRQQALSAAAAAACLALCACGSAPAPVLRSSVQGFTALQAEAPARLRAPLRSIVAVYRADERIVRTSGSVGQMSQSMATRNLAASGAFRRLLLYMSAKCR
jgi:predicted Zn-dependent protease